LDGLGPCRSWGGSVEFDCIERVAYSQAWRALIVYKTERAVALHSARAPENLRGEDSTALGAQTLIVLKASELFQRIEDDVLVGTDRQPSSRFK